MKFMLSKHKVRRELDVIEFHDSKGRLIATIEPGDPKDGPSLLIQSVFMDKVGLVGGADAGVVIKFIDPEKKRAD
jgi:hypothetical protein